MNTFLVIAAVMAAIAASAVALPLLRHRQSRVLGAAAATIIIGAAALLYPLWSNWNWRAPARSAAGPDVAAMVAKLEKHLKDQPSDLTGWLMLGRSYLALNRLDDALVAYDHAHRLDGKNPDAAMGLGEAMSLRAGGEITPEASQLFEEALSEAPGNPQALLYGGFAAATRGDRALARSRWQTLKNMHPPPQIEQMLDARIAELGPPGTGAATEAAPAGTSASPAGTSTSDGGLSGTEVTVNISIAPALKSRLVPEAPLFVFAREPGSKGPPLAAKRLTSSAIGTQVHLSAADSMLPGRTLVKGQQVSITARVSFSGKPVPSAGDLYGELSYDVGRDGARNLVIDRVAE
ncbi:MAG TPA: tetratricopeptide repeat protein [Steroidobacteraceae bacterium]